MTLTHPPFTVTATEFTVDRAAGRSPEYQAMRDWLEALTEGVWPDDILRLRSGTGYALFPVGYGVRRDLTHRWVEYEYVNDHQWTAMTVEDCISTGVVQLESAPPDWPPIIRQYVQPE